jgi:hypothetical protein
MGEHWFASYHCPRKSVPQMNENGSQENSHMMLGGRHFPVSQLAIFLHSWLLGVPCYTMERRNIYWASSPSIVTGKISQYWSPSHQVPTVRLVQCLSCVIPDTQEVYIRGSWFKASPGKKGQWYSISTNKLGVVFHFYGSSYMEGCWLGESWFRLVPGKNTRPYWKITKAKRAGGVA